MKRIVVNGANGYVASHFINELLPHNYEVIALVRDSSNYASEDRMNKVLSRINDTAGLRFKNLKVFNYSLLDEDFSLPGKQLDEIFEKPVDYFHFAACLKFDLKNKDEIFRTNVDGIENSIKVFLKYSRPESRFFYISTVYSCGRFSGLFEERFYDNESIDSFRNYYEQSKRYAENVIRKYIAGSGLNGYVIRLSQVVGDNKTGITRTDFGIFDFIRRVNDFSRRYPENTVRIRIDPDSTQNLISIDNTSEYMVRILTIHELPQVINFVGRNFIKNNWIISCMSELLPIRIIQDKALERPDLNAMERIIAAGMSFTGEYADTNILFDRKNLDKYICPDGNEVTEQSLYKMIEYFIKERNKSQTT